MNASIDPLVGRVLDGRYEIQARIGEGGMGVVYRARQMSIDRTVAIKMLSPQMAADPNWVQRFYNEAKACSRLQHPNTIRMFDFGQTSDGRLFMTMELLEGISLRQAIVQGPMAYSRVLKILIQCCASLAEAHSIGIIHRDIKPDNVFLLTMGGAPDFVKLLDFSVAKLLQEGGDRMSTQAGVVFGTPQYMSPEQGRGLPLDARADLYGLGILAYEMLTGNLPFHDDHPMQVIQMQLHAQVPPMSPSTPPIVQAIVRRALEKDALRRFQSAGEMMSHCQAALTELNASQGQGMRPPMPGVPNHGYPQAPPPQAAYPQAPPPQAPPNQRTMIAQAVEPPPGYAPGPPPPGYAPPPPGYAQAPPALSAAAASLPSYATASPGQKTMIAEASQTAPMAPLVPQPPVAAARAAAPPMPAPAAASAGKTVMLESSAGVVSVAKQGRPVQPASFVNTGASPIFWAVSLLTGVAVGVVAYIVYLQV